MDHKERKERLREYLRDGEEVLWHGWAEPCKFLEGKDKPRILKNWGIASAVAGGFLVYYVNAVPTVEHKIIVVVLAILAVILCMPYVEWRKLTDQQYWITNQRIISSRGKKEFSGIDMELVDAVDVKKLHNGNDCVLLCGKIVKEGEKQLRWRSGSPAEGDVPGEVGMVFYNVVRAKEAVDTIRSMKGDI